LSRVSCRKQLDILLLERNLAEPQRIVRELLQPGGVIALKTMDIADTLGNIGAIPVHGYGVVHGGKSVQIPYPQGYEGRSFHHGRFVQALRGKAKQAKGVEVVEATVTGLEECSDSNRVIGVKAKLKGQDSPQTYFADLTFIADGCSSNLRSSVMPNIMSRSSCRSFFFGVILEDARLPYSQHGTVVLIPGGGPVLLYQIEEHDTRMLIDIKEPLPKDIKVSIDQTASASFIDPL
jgi:squalene monooxygenase